MPPQACSRLWSVIESILCHLKFEWQIYADLEGMLQAAELILMDPGGDMYHIC